MRGSGKQEGAGGKGKYIFALFLVALGILVFYYNFRIDDTKYDAIIEKTAKKYNLDSRLVKAVIFQESRFDPGARGLHGEIGLMQIMPDGAAVDWAKHYKVDNVREGLLFSPALNIEIGAWYLAEALKRWHKYKYANELALCQYNAGGKRAEAWKPEKYDGEVIDRIKIPSTRAYVKAIIRKYETYCENDR
ncbi:MAG: lytic transglycosylase domain-containing protein [Victivallaceae bacterium]|nr:lytic transglycosylase domain-containing protein [Victivallaceae bacterium]